MKKTTAHPMHSKVLVSCAKTENGVEWTADLVIREGNFPNHCGYFNSFLLESTLQQVCGHDLTVKYHQNPRKRFWAGMTVRGGHDSVVRASDVLSQLNRLLAGDLKHIISRWGELENRWTEPFGLIGKGNGARKFTSMPYLIPSISVGCLVGRKGHQIKSIEDETGALIHVCPGELREGMKFLLIFGSQEQCEHAVAIVSRIKPSKNWATMRNLNG